MVMYSPLYDTRLLNTDARRYTYPTNPIVVVPVPVTGADLVTHVGAVLGITATSRNRIDCLPSFQLHHNKV